MQILLNISDTLALQRDVREVFPQISAFLRRVLRHEYAAFGLYDEHKNLFVRQALDFPLGKGLLREVTAVTSNGPQGRALTERRPLILSEDELMAFRLQPAESGIGEHFFAEGLKSLCCVPLLRPRGPQGMLSLASTRADAFKAEDLALLNQVGTQLAIALENARVAQQLEELKIRLAEEKRYLEREIRTEVNFEEIVGQSSALRKVLDQVTTVATSDATVLILGETGTGKELIARAVHRMSRRKDRSFVKVNCAAIPTGLLESELFGHEKGAFTGAISQKIGRLELANEGTLFLDEVGEIPLELQPKLLRVLQDHEFERLGGVRTLKVNLRLIAATNRDLGRGVAEQKFRSDLFYRLNVFPVRTPPLRERREDIPMLVRYFVHKYARRMDRQIETIPTDAMTALTNYPWPGNVRELENLMERSVILSEGSALQVPLAELEAEVRSNGAADHTLEGAEREHIVRVLRETGGLISGPTGAAHRLGVKRTTLQSKMQRLEITRKDYSGPKKT
jgi:formate hydrogenlyase transcriptional activator